MEDSSSSSSTNSNVVQDLIPNVLHCQICRSPPRSPIATSCGHMYCWPCLYRHLQGRRQSCPVCRTLFRIVPIYGVDTSGDGPGDGIPPRPGITPPPVSVPIPTPSEIREGFAVVEMVNERLRNEKRQALQAHTDRYMTLFSVLRGLRTRVVDGEDLSPEQNKDLVRTSITTVYGAMKGIGEQLKELRIVRHRFEKMLRLVTRVGGYADVWWDHGAPVVELIAATGVNYATGLIFHGELNSQF